MHLTGRTVRNLFIGGVALLLAFALLRAAVANNEHPACERYSDLLAADLPETATDDDKAGELLGFRHASQAQKDFEGELKNDPDAGCAARGLARLALRDCVAGERLLDKSLLTRAEKVFVGQLDNDAGASCARLGLRHVADRRCQLARRLRKKFPARAKEALKSESLPDAPMVCPRVIPESSPSPPKKPKRPKPKPDDPDAGDE